MNIHLTLVELLFCWEAHPSYFCDHEIALKGLYLQDKREAIPALHRLPVHYNEIINEKQKSYLH